MKNCKVCGEKTNVVFNIGFKATPICEGCANAIFLQQANWYAHDSGKTGAGSLTLDTLQKYNEFLLKHGYTDTDVISEEPTAIDQFLAEQRKN